MNEIKDNQAILADAQYIVEDPYYRSLSVQNVPLDENGELPHPQLTMREAKRALRQIHKLMHRGDGSLDWMEGWTNSNYDQGKLGLLVFGCNLDHEAQKMNPENRYGFSSWLWRVAEQLGYDCTNADQTSRCGDCNKGIDSGSSTPDYYCLTDGDIFCNSCANDNVSDSLKRSDTGFLSWKPIHEGFDYSTGLIHLRFNELRQAQAFERDHLDVKFWVIPSGGDYRPCSCYVHATDFKRPLHEAPTEDRPWEELYSAYTAEIGEFPWYSRHEDKPFGLQVWEWIADRIDEEKNPLLKYFATHKLTGEVVLFESDVKLIDSLIAEWNENSETKASHVDLRLTIEEIEEN